MNSQLRVLVVSNMYPSNDHPAYGVFVRDHVTGLRRAGAHVRTVAITDPRRGLLRTPWKYASLLFRVIVTSLARRPDVIEGHYLTPTALVAATAAWLSRRPYVLYAHGSDVALPHGRLVGRILHRAIGAADEVHANSTWTAHLLAEHFDVESVIIPPGVDTELFRPPAQSAARAGIAFAGGLYPHKGADVLLRALPSLPVEVSLSVAGCGPEETNLRSLAEQLGIDHRVHWLGEIDHRAVASLLGGAAVTAVPSRRDALGLVAVEALACGTPVVVSSVGGLAGIPTPDCGSLVPPDDPAALAAELLVWLQRDGAREAIEVAAVERASAFALPATAAATLRRLSAVVGRYGT